MWSEEIIEVDVLGRRRLKERIDEAAQLLREDLLVRNTGG